ncbi:MAG TPA: FtsX-like permease family protein [Nocardia sp.]|uniref:ABC transporter permease n=1 Tax=Nocardia sp. TaxID=1821 RepID=UPI002B4AF3BD|nr:FtsX-like permease family protein [Nocardia sp.]HLS79350.1 FtsX-like permease family protein [Nocardia sp.]
MRAALDRLRLFNIGELLAHPGRTLMSLTVMGVSAGLLVSVLSISGSVTGSVERLTRALGGDAVLEVTGITDAGFAQDLLPAVAATPGVAHAVPMLRAPLGTGEDRALLLGADASVTALGSELAGPMGAQAAKLLSTPNGVLVGAAMGRAEGERFELGGQTVTVAGVLDDETSRKLNGGHLVAAPLPLAQRITDRAGRLDSIQIVAADGADVARLRSALTDAVAGRAVVADPDLRAAQAGGAMQIVRYSTLMSAVAALIVSAFLIYNAMSMAVAQRRPMLSLVRAIGGRRGPMVGDLLVEAALLGLLGGAVGAVIGMFTGRLTIDLLPAAMVQSVEARTEYMVPGYAVPVAVAACVLASVAAAALAARQVYKVAPVEALVPVGSGQADVASPLLRGLAAVAGVLTVAAAITVAYLDLGRLSLAAISLAFLAGLLLCFAATGPIVRGAAAIARIFGGPGTLGATTLERAPRRVWATAMTVMIGVAATVAIGGAAEDMVDSATGSFAALGETDLYVSPGSMEAFPTGPLMDPELKSRIAELPGVASVDPAQMAFATVGGGRIMLQGYPTERGVVRVGSVDRAVLPRLDSGEAVVISRDVARSQGVDAGDRLVLDTPSGPRDVEVAQVIPYMSAIAGVIMMDLDHLREWYGRPGETLLAVEVETGADPAEVRAAIAAIVPAGYHVDTGDEVVTAVSSSMRQGSAMSRSILWIVVLVATVALLNTLMLSVLERRRELGVLRAIGTGRRFLLRSVLAEAAGIGVVGALIGLLVGAGAQYLSDMALGHAVTIDIAYSPDPVLLVYGLAALLLALLGSIPPAIRAARMPIVQALAVD